MTTAETLKEITRKARKKSDEEKRKLAMEYLNSLDFTIQLTDAANCGRDCTKVKIPEKYLSAKSVIVEEMAVNGFGLDWVQRDEVIVRWL